MTIRSKSPLAMFAAFLLLLTLALNGQSSLTNDSVVKMVKAGLSDDVIVSMISSQPAQFAVTPEAMIALKKEGVSDKIIAAMVSKPQPSAPGQPAAAAPATTAAAPAAPAAPDSTAALDIGVYSRKKEEWVEVLPEVVNWKTGGFMKRVATGGIVKGDVNGNLKGTQSKNRVTTPAEFLIKTAEGVAITEYQLIRLRKNKSEREFRTVTGGVFNSSGGATRDLVEFEGKRIAGRTYVVAVPTSIGQGEYGFLPPGAVTSSNSASLGKMYTFQIVE